MMKTKISPKEVLEANKEAFVHFTLHDFRVLVETRGIEFVMDKMDEETYWTLSCYFGREM